VPRILVVEDWPEVLDVIQRVLESNGYRVETAVDGEDRLNKALELEPSLVVLDVRLPRLDGLRVTQQLRRRAFRAPVLMVSALDSASNRVVGLDAGADDYVAKPFDCLELLARVRALLRRLPPRSDAAATHLSLDPLHKCAFRAGQVIALGPKEYALLDCLVRARGATVARHELFEHAWKRPLDPASNVLTVYMSHLRDKIDNPAFGPPLLQTTRRKGYAIKASGSAMKV
jgi:DNA-binding response OmpR family regulator